MVQLSFVKVTKPHLECCGLGDVFIFRLPSQSLLPEISKNLPFRSHARCGRPIWFVFAPSNVFKVIFQQVCSFLKESPSALQNLIPVDHKLWAAVCRQKTGRWQSKNLHDGVKTWSPVQQMSVVVQMQKFSWKVIHKGPGCHQLEHHVQISQVQMPRRIILEENRPIGEVSKIPVNMKQVATALITWLHCSITSFIDKHCWDAVQLFAKGVDRRIVWALQIDQNTMLRRQTQVIQPVQMPLAKDNDKVNLGVHLLLDLLTEMLRTSKDQNMPKNHWEIGCLSLHSRVWTTLQHFCQWQAKSKQQINVKHERRIHLESKMLELFEALVTLPLQLL